VEKIMRILCIGDSNTWGYVPGEDGVRTDKRWTKLLAEFRPNDTIIEEALCGRTVTAKDTIVPVRCGIDTLPILMLSHVPVDLVIIMLGTNDLKKQFNPSAKHIARGIEELLPLRRKTDGRKGSGTGRERYRRVCSYARNGMDRLEKAALQNGYSPELSSQCVGWKRTYNVLCIGCLHQTKWYNRATIARAPHGKPQRYPHLG